MAYTDYSKIADNVIYQHWLGQLGTTKIPEALSLINFRITLALHENGEKQ